MSDSNSESVVESDSEGEGQEKIFKKIKTSSLLDEPNKDRFMGLILKLINKIEMEIFSANTKPLS